MVVDIFRLPKIKHEYLEVIYLYYGCGIFASLVVWNENVEEGDLFE